MEEYNVTGLPELSSPTITKLAKAMLKVQAAIGPAFKDKANDFTKSRYATLNSVMDACITILTENGILVAQYPVECQLDKGLGLVTKLVHVESGEWQSSLLVMPLVKNVPQSYGSALTYARRYGLSALVGIVTEDDNANMACNQGSKGIVHNSFESTVQPQPQPQPQQTTATPTNNPSIQPSMNNPPKIDGVNYQQLTAGNGALYFVYRSYV